MLLYLYEVERSADYSNFAKDSKMAFTARTITATFKDGEQIKRRTHRVYTHVDKGEDKWGNQYKSGPSTIGHLCSMSIMPLASRLLINPAI